MKAETSESVYSTTSCDIPEDCALQRHLCQKLRPRTGLPDDQLLPLTVSRLHELDFMVRVHIETAYFSKTPWKVKGPLFVFVSCYFLPVFPSSCYIYVSLSLACNWRTAFTNSGCQLASFPQIPNKSFICTWCVAYIYVSLGLPLAKAPWKIFRRERSQRHPYRKRGKEKKGENNA